MSAGESLSAKAHSKRVVLADDDFMLDRPIYQGTAERPKMAQIFTTFLRDLGVS